STTSQPNYYVVTSTGQIWRGSPESNWELACNCGSIAPGLGVQRLAADSNNPDRIVAVFNVFDGGGNIINPGPVVEVRRLPNGAWQSQTIITAFNTASPTLQVNRMTAVIVDPLNSDKIFVGTDQGIYRGFLQSGTWVWTRSPGIPNVEIMDLKVHERNGTLTG